MKYDRLTKRGGYSENLDMKQEYGYGKIYTMLSRLEDEIEDGKLIPFDCERTLMELLHVKMRENELHEPTVTFFPAHDGFLPTPALGEKRCAVCCHPLIVMYGLSEQEAKALPIPNYCPNCGARLKEVEHK